MKILLAGGGKLVYFLARTFQAKGYAAVIVNPDMEECRWLAKRLKSLIVHGDASDPRILEEARAEEMDVILAATPRDEVNLAICQIGESLFGVRRTMALVQDPEQEAVFLKLGVSGAFSITQILSGLIERRVETEGVVNLVPLGEGQVNLTEVALSRTAPVAGKALKDVSMPPDSLITCIIRQGHTIIPRGDTVIEGGDRLVTLTAPENHAKVLRLLTGERG